MRICVVSYHSSPLEAVGSGKSGGMSIVLRSLYRHLARFADVDIFVRGDEQIVKMAPRVRVIPLQKPRARAFGEEILNYHDIHRYDLIHTHYWLSGIIGLQLNHLLKVPWLHTLHTVEILKAIPKDKARIEIEEEIIRSCDLVVSPTRQEAWAIKALYPDAKVIAVPHGVDTRQFRPSQDGHKNVLFVGRIDPIKGIHLLIDALRLVKQDINLTVVGGASKTAATLDEIKTYAADLPVDFVGKARHEELASYYKKAAMLVVPSFYESFGLVGLEAMASARPVVGFLHTGLRETVSDDAGLLVEMGVRNLAKAIDVLLRDNQLCRRLGNRGRAKALSYDWSNIAKKYKSIYERIIQE
jgi:D-inositol-3-phosphate glycosyltransferase